MTPEYIFDTHTLNACVDGGDICNGCLEAWPCHAFLVTCWAIEQIETRDRLVADLVEQRDALLPGSEA